MTPAARYTAAIEVLEVIFEGAPAEKALLNWSRGHRFAGSKDRAAIRDHVFDALRCKRSLARLGGGETARAVVIGLVRDQGLIPEDIFSGQGYAPDVLSADERAVLLEQVKLSDAEIANLPDGLWGLWKRSLQDEAMPAALATQSRGPVTLRVCTQTTNREDLIRALAGDDIVAVPLADCKTALQVTKNPRRLLQSSAFLSGMFEFQDASSQMAMASLNLPKGASVLDYCAGGGGKALALADLFQAKVTAHDIDPNRMRDLPDRAKRVGVSVKVIQSQVAIPANFDCVLVDAPCSGSGTWRRTPDTKWKMTSKDVVDYSATQLKILNKSKDYVSSGGILAYSTCSVFKEENDQVIDQFINANSDWKIVDQLRLIPTKSHDGFFLTQLKGVL